MRNVLLLSGIIFILCGCSAPYYMKRGNVIAATGRFDRAAVKYEKSYDKAKDKKFQSMAALQAGDMHEQVNHLKEAYNWFKKSQRCDKENADIYLKMADICVRLDDSLAAREYYAEYDSLFGGNQGKDGIYRLRQQVSDRRDYGRYSVQQRRELNSRYGDFSPVYFPGDTCIVFFTSTRKTDNKRRKVRKDPVTGDGYCHIYEARFVHEVRSVDKTGKVKVKRFNEPRWLQPVLLKDSLYSLQGEGCLCFAKGGEELYFTSSRPLKEGHVGTRIYRAVRQNSDEDDVNEFRWMDVGLAGVCGDSVTLGHPALTPDGMRLYFVTDALPGGFGGKDIWYVENENGKWGKPVNAGELVNTAGNEMFPVVRDNGELYFASDGHYGLGGLDLYKIENKDGREVRIHLPAPLNSYADDFGIAFKLGQEEGLFTSSRDGRGDHIWGFKYLPQQLEVKMLAKNEISEMPVTRAEVVVTADDGSVTYLETDSTGCVRMPVIAEREYVFVVSHPQYLKGKGIVSTYREKADRLYDLAVMMQPIEQPIVIPNIYFDVAKWDLRPDARENLEVLLQILKDNPNITIELSAHTDMVGNDRANMILSENRAQAVVDFLIEKGIYWDRLEAKGYGESLPRQINEKDAREYSFLKTGDVLTETFVRHLQGEQKEIAMQLNRRIEFKVLRTNYMPTSASLHNPHRKAVAAGENVKEIDGTQLKDLHAVEGKFYTLQLGVFKNVPTVIYQFKVVFTERLSNGTVRYCTGIYDTREEAVKAAGVLKKKGVECIVKEYVQ